MAHCHSAPSLRASRDAAATSHPTPATRLVLKEEIPDGWSVPRYAPNVANYVSDVKTQFLRRPEALPAAGEPVALRTAPPRKGIVEEDAAKRPYGWSVPRYDMQAAERTMSRKYPRGKYLETKELTKRRDVESRPGGLAAGNEEDCDVPYGWSVKRYAPHMANYHTDAMMGWTHLRSSRAPQHDGAAAKGDSRLYLTKENALCRDGQGRAALDKRTDEEFAKDVPYGWNVPRYAPSAVPRLNRSVQDPAARYYAGATPAAKHARSEFRA